MPVHDDAVGDQEGGQGATATGEGAVGWRRSRIFTPPGDAAQRNQWKTPVNGNNYSSGRALDYGNVDNDDNGLGDGGPALMIKDEDGQSGVATGGDDKGTRLRSHLICGIGRGAGIRHNIHSECIVTWYHFFISVLSFRVK